MTTEQIEQWQFYNKFEDSHIQYKGLAVNPLNQKNNYAFAVGYVQDYCQHSEFEVSEIFMEESKVLFKCNSLNLNQLIKDGVYSKGAYTDMTSAEIAQELDRFKLQYATKEYLLELINKIQFPYLIAVRPANNLNFVEEDYKIAEEFAETYQNLKTRLETN